MKTTKEIYDQYIRLMNGCADYSEKKGRERMYQIQMAVRSVSRIVNAQRGLIMNNGEPSDYLGRFSDDAHFYTTFAEAVRCDCGYQFPLLIPTTDFLPSLDAIHKMRGKNGYKPIKAVFVNDYNFRTESYLEEVNSNGDKIKVRLNYGVGSNYEKTPFTNKMIKEYVLKKYGVEIFQLRKTYFSALRRIVRKCTFSYDTEKFDIVLDF